MLELKLLPISVLIVDGHELMRQGIRNLLECHPEIDLVGEASGSDAAMLIISRSHPKVVILDISLQQGSGIELSKAIADSEPEAHILVFTARADENSLSCLLKYGAIGYLLKSSPAQDLVKAIHDVADGRMVFPPEITGTVRGLIRSPAEKDIRTNQCNDLTPREIEVLSLVGEGFKDREIAESLHISCRTVEAHIRKILRKLGAANRAQALLKFPGSG